ncbi:MAG TPA: hypothetical protein VEK57_23725 [Thermoanaerobaculia bacterium]|nr:hypothetical protein [Thermoanaerobaculia bacterium]
MGKHTLTLIFAGICAHFRDTVPGVPHRVVLPDASSLRFGLLRMADGGPTATYYLLPHFAILQTGEGELTVPGVMDHGHIYAGARLQVSNATGPLTYESRGKESYELTPSIGTFVPLYDYSEDVVFGGRAACYFDVFNGTVSSYVAKGGARNIRIVMETEGPPILTVTSFGSSAAPATPFSLTLKSSELAVANTDLHAPGEDTPFDYLLHYLTAQRSLPQILKQTLPGMGSAFPPPPPADLVQKLQTLAPLIARGHPSREELALINPDELNPSCSDTRYP